MNPCYLKSTFVFLTILDVSFGQGRFMFGRSRSTCLPYSSSKPIDKMKFDAGCLNEITRKYRFTLDHTETIK